MDARPGGPAAKREPSPEGLGINSEEDLSAVGAALNLARPARTCVTRQPLGYAFLLDPAFPQPVQLCRTTPANQGFN
jgi:hypothetical protein